MLLTYLLHTFIELWVLKVVHFFFNYPVYYLKRVWNWLDDYHVAIDKYRSMEHCKLTRSVPYGPHHREKFHVLAPTLHTTIRGNIFYVHGGGFVASCREMYYNSFTYLVRRGYRVFVVDYPLSPGSRHPQPTLSILRCLHFLKTNPSWGIQQLHMAGDSAGSNLILLATSIVSNGQIRQDFISCVKHQPCSTFVYPTVLTCMSIYGMIHRKKENNHDCKTWSSFGTRLGLQYLWACISNYEKEPELNTNTFPISFQDVLERYSVLHLPPTEFFVGDSDPLLDDSKLVHQRMVQGRVGFGGGGSGEGSGGGSGEGSGKGSGGGSGKGSGNTPPVLHVYQGGFHGFFGLPPEWQPFGMWQTAALPCAEDVYSFLSKHTMEKRNEQIKFTGSRTIGLDFYGVIVIYTLAVVMPFVIAVGPTVVAYLVYQTGVLLYHKGAH